MLTVSTLDVKCFVDYLEGERGFSPHTLRAYLNDLDQFCDYLQHGPQSFQRNADRPTVNIESL
jgi:site-specific recombinase XerD